MHPVPPPGPQPWQQPRTHADVESDSKTTREADFNFRFGTRRVAARGKVCGHHPNVVFLRVLPSTLGRLSDCLSRFLPATWKDRSEARWPEWFLPDRIILKREKPGWKEEFDNEVGMYKLLAPLGGHVVPKLYGQIEYPSTDNVKRRALIISDIGGIPLGEPEVGSLPLGRVEEMLNDAFRAVADAGVDHCDAKLDNIHVVDDRIMLIDFDTSEPVTEDVDPEYCAYTAVNHVLRQYIRLHDRFPKGIPWGVLPSHRRPRQTWETVDLSRPEPLPQTLEGFGAVANRAS